MKNRTKIYIILVFLDLLVVIACILAVKLNNKPIVYLRPITKFEFFTKVEAKEPELLIQGKASYYSKAGCLGCHPQQIMANGEKFDENKMTLAIGRQYINGKMTRKPLIPLNTLVKVCGTEKCVTAKITDTGGFYTPRFGFRIADLSLGLAKALDFKTDTIIKIYEI